MMKQPRDPNPVRAFTMMEVLVVIAILALLASVASFKLVRPYRRASLEYVVAQIAFYERRLRSKCSNWGHGAQLIVHSNGDRLETTIDDASNRHLRPLHLGHGVRVTRILALGQHGRLQSRSIKVNAFGETPSYALELNNGQGHPKWLFFAGITGQMKELETESDVRQIFSLLEGGADAN